MVGSDLLIAYLIAWDIVVVPQMMTGTLVDCPPQQLDMGSEAL